MEISKEDIDKMPSEKGDIEDYEKLNDKELKKQAMEDLQVDETFLDNEQEKESMFSKKTNDAMANLEFFSEKLENTLRGKSLVRKGDNEEVYEQSGKAVVGESFIKQVSSLLKTFGNKPMLLSGKDEKLFMIQFEDMFYTLSDMTLERKHNFDVVAVRGILKDIKDSFWNIGNILIQTKPNMNKYFGGIEKKDDENMRKASSPLDN